MKITEIRKPAAALILFLLILSPFYAADLKMEGTGASVEDARADARSNLSEYINGVFVESSTLTSSYDDSVTSTDILSSSSSTTSNGYLKSVEYTNEYRKGTEYYSTAVIKDNDTNLAALKDSLKTSKTTIETLYGKLSKQTGEQKKNSLITIYATLTEYEAYRTILIYMGHGDVVPELSVNVTTTSIFIEYQNVVIEEGYALEEREKLITDETEHQKLLEELSANRTEQRRLEKEKNEAASAREEAARQALIERLKQYEAITHSQAKITAKTDLERYNSLRENITSSRSNFLNACTEYDNLCREQFALVDKDYEAEKSAVEARPYRYAELDGNNPTPAAKQVRDDEIDYLYTLKELHKVEIFKQIRTALLPQIRERYDVYCDAFDAIDGQSFDIILSDDTIDRITVSFDSINVIWTVNIKLRNIDCLKGYTDGYSFTLTYNQLTGKDVKEPRYRGQQGYDEYMSYLDDIDYLDTVMRSFADSFRITLSFKTSVNKEDIGIGYSGYTCSLIDFGLESNALNTDSTWTLVVSATPSSVVSQAFSWTLPGYAKTFDLEFE